MTTIKSYTDIEQSKKLAEILPITSIDFAWNIFSDGSTRLLRMDDWEVSENAKSNVEIIPCWSLAALLNAVDFNTINLHYDNARTDWVASATIYDSTKHCTKYESTRALNPIDACVEMILKLDKLNQL